MSCSCGPCLVKVHGRARADTQIQTTDTHIHTHHTHIGGDVFKFAGDAILVVWPPSDEDMTTKVRRAVRAP